MEEEEVHHSPHVVILPFPAQGHVKPMLRLAELLCLANFNVTFVNSDHNHRRLINSDYKPRINLRLEALSDGLPPEHPRKGLSAVELFSSTNACMKPLFKELTMAISLRNKCVIIADGIMSFAIDVAKEIGVPVITFRTYSASCTWLHFHIDTLFRQVIIPFQENGDMDRAINCIPGFENILRFRDLPSIFKLDINDPIVQFYMTQTSTMTQASGLILNTCEQLEAPFISKLASLFSNIYTIGPLHAQTSESDSSDGSLWKQDRTCMTWLDSQPSKSVLYISFGSIINVTHDQLIEFWYGVVNSDVRFLWAIRPDLVIGNDVMTPPKKLLEATKERGCMVEWAPQEEVLAHWAVGGFLTHCGWNSTLESIYAGVSMIGWPQIADQPVNSRCVSELWKIGFDMKDTCDRFTVEKMVRELMEEGDKRDEVLKSTVEIAKMAHESVNEGGSSYRNMEKLVDDIRSMCFN